MILLNCLWIIYSVQDKSIFPADIYSIKEYTPLLCITCGLIGIWLAIKLIKTKISSWTAVPINLGLTFYFIIERALLKPFFTFEIEQDNNNRKEH